MPSLIESLSSIINPEIVDALGRTLGADPGAVSKAVGTVGPLLMNGMAKMTATPGGADSLLKILPQESDGPFGGFGSLGALISNIASGGASGSGMVTSLLGPGINAISASLSKALGFNVAPLIGIVAPAIVGLVSKAVRTDKLDGAGLSAMLNRQVKDYTDNPANRETVALVDGAMRAGETASRQIASYGADWAKIAAAPVAAMLAVSSSDLDGPFDTMKEIKAAQAALFEATKAAPDGSVLSAALGGGLTPAALKSVREMAKDREALTRLIGEAATAIKQRSPAEVEAFKTAIRAVGKATAEAAKEGGFLGIGGTLVSDDEKAALQKIETALA